MKSEQIKPHKRLSVWQKSIELAIEVYKATERYPSEERFGLTSQMRRAVISIGSNIAEGAGRQSAKEFLQFLYIARGSISELDTQFEISTRLGYLPIDTRNKLDTRLEEISKMLNGLIKQVSSKQ
ncbi:MAG: four helix bundle protein [bacterium]|nr:four helix bundle protein [bacterium]